MKSLVRRTLRALGFELVRYRPRTAEHPDLSGEDWAILDRVAGCTMTSVERQIALIHAVRHLVRHEIQGSFVECGVWRGGSSMAIALTLAQEGDTARELFLYDTFEGMTRPQDVDRARDGSSAQSQLDLDAQRTGLVWAVAGLEDVQRNLRSTGYPEERIHYVRGPVETTLPSRRPAGPIALLRLDTDWYESTKHELIHLFPLLSDGGILIVDDYGHWEGAKKAVDEYLADLGRSLYLHRIDYTGRLLVKR